ncbi:LysR family transcriptional regulator [Sphingobium amiense]|nr:LysR family transcriptional regulator [Sphingobium amiense]
MTSRSPPVRAKWARLGLDLVSLRLIVAAAEEQSFAAAAQRENTSLSAVSRRVAELEARIGVLLFDRRDRGVSLTDAGKTFVSQLYDVFERLDRMALDLEAARGGARGLVRLHAHMSATVGELPAKLAAFTVANPGIEVMITEETSAAAAHAVSVGTADLALISGTLPPSDLSIIPWLEDELVVILPMDHALGGRASIRLEDLIGDPFIGMQRDSALLSLYRQQVHAMGQQLNERAHATSFESIRHMVSEGLGVAILPAAAAYPHADDNAFMVRKLDESWARRSLVLCAREPERRSAATRLLIEHLVAGSAGQSSSSR